MEKITSLSELRESILQLEIKQANESRQLKEEWKLTVEKLKPANLIKSSINDMITSSGLKENILNTVLSLAVGFLTKKAVVGSTHNPLKQILGALLQAGVTGLVSKNADGIKSTAVQVIKLFLDKKKKKEEAD